MKCAVARRTAIGPWPMKEIKAIALPVLVSDPEIA
jgi:hypothetical protein